MGLMPEITIGNYHLDIDGDYDDPLVQNNASDEKILIDGEDITVGFIYNCVYKQRNAFEYGLRSIRNLYPDSPIYIVSDGGYDYQYLEDEIGNLKYEMGLDTMGPYKKVDIDNFIQEEHQQSVKNNIAATVDRLEKGIEFCGNPDWIFMTEPDVLLRGKFSVPKNAKLLGTRLNTATMPPALRLDQWVEFNKILCEIDTSIPIFRWGAVPPIFHTETYLKAIKIYKENFDVLTDITKVLYAVNCYDIIMPFFFSLVGEPEVFNSEITECLRNPNWKTSSHPILHQWRELYEQSDHYGG
tara:strand:- start:1418 stop:2311 length:894 start_codon:yes stop_codon:yes gene_type:complete